MKVLFFLALLVSCTFGQLALSDINTLISLHNTARASASPTPAAPLPYLTWDNSIANYTQSWVNQCKASYSPKFYSTLYGENPVIMSRLDVTGAFNYWMSQAPHFNFATASCSGGACLNYLQIVANQSTTFGCGAAKCSFGEFLVCDYRRFAQYSGALPYTPAGTPGSTTGSASSTASATATTTTAGATTTTTAGATTTTTAGATTTTTTTTAAAATTTITTFKGTTSTTGSAPTTGSGYAAIDYRGTFAVGPIKDQKQCGDCWAFSATAVAEGAIGFAGTNGPPLSEQDTLDCSGGGSCNGGWPSSALKGIIKNGGLDTQASYPYTAKDGNCSHTAANLGGKISKSGQTAGDFATMYNALKTYGPVGIAVAADNTWQRYSGGVLSSTSTSIDHAVTIVGYDPTLSAWIVRNSWGVSWGMSGYCYLSTAAPCGAQLNGAFYAIA